MVNSLKTFNATKKNGWIIRSGTFIEPSSKIGRNLETGHNVVIRENCSLGDNVKVWSNTVIDYSCTIGNEVKIHCNCYLSQFTTIGNNVFVAPGVVMLNDVHPGCAYSRQCMRGPTIEDGAQIGGNSTILPYIRVGKGSLIGGGSVVTKSIPPNSVAYGVPAHIAGSVFNLRCKIGLNHKPYREL